MKKFVSIVLALALALSLCTVAFATSTSTVGGDTTTKTVPMKGYTVLDMVNQDCTNYVLGAEDVRDENFELKTTTNKVVTVDDEVTTTYTADKYTINGGVYFSVDSSVAEYKLVKNGAVEAWLINCTNCHDTVGTTDGMLRSSKVVDKVVAKADSKDCGVYVYAAGTDAGKLAKAYVVGDDAFATDGTGYYFPAVLDGKIMFLKGELELVKHVFDTTKINATKGTINSAYCSVCEEYINLVKGEDIPVKDVALYTVALDKDGNVVKDAKNNSYYYLKETVGGTVSKDDATTTTVDSSKTFDAGVAMYVGLSLMSVAGSAVVIGKKKEF